MLYRLPLKQQESPKWLTATLVAIYLFVTAFLFLDKPQDNSVRTDISHLNAYTQNQSINTPLNY